MGLFGKKPHAESVEDREGSGAREAYRPEHQGCANPARLYARTVGRSARDRERDGFTYRDGGTVAFAGPFRRYRPVLGRVVSVLLGDAAQKEAFGELFGEAVKDLPLREKEFVYGFAVQYAQHWRARKKK